MTTYTVRHRNGIGDVKSEWYTDKNGISKEEATNLVTELRGKSHDGWKSDVEMIPDEDQTND